ncbi:MAG: PAS domain-containing protein, partial [Bdellovibrionales bacterium]|nr:PAS domain-containing protein [Bdellovibrionales bacterium]
MTDLGTQAIAIKAASIRRVYLSALCLFGLCLLWIFFSNSEESISLSSFETVINLSGRQRMLSQRIIVLATEIVAQNGIQSSQARTELQESLESFVRVQRALKLGDASLGILAFHSKESLDLYEQISPHFRKLTESVSNLLAATDRYEKERLFLEARGASHRCLPLMDRLVDLLTEEALDLSQKYHRTQNLVLFLQFLLFVLSAPFLFEPLVKRLKEIDEQQNIVLEKLRESEERFTLAVEGSDDGLWDWNVKTDDVLYSDRFVELLGYQPNNFPSRLESWANLLHPDDLGPTMEAVRKHLEEQLPYDVEYRCKSPSGDYNWFRAKGQAIWDKSGVATRMAGSLSDITDSKTERLELESATKRLQLALEATNTGLWDW